MKRILLILLALVFIYPMISIGADKDSISLNLVWEKEFNEPIVDIIIDTSNIKSITPKVVIFNDKFSIFNKGKEVQTIVFFDKKKQDGDVRISRSPNGKYVLFAKDPVDLSGPDWIGGTIYNNEGNIIMKISKEVPFYVSNDGYIIAYHPIYCVPEMPKYFAVYSIKGIKIGKISIPFKSNIGDAWTIFTKSQNYIIAFFSSFKIKKTFVGLYKIEADNIKNIFESMLSIEYFHNHPIYMNYEILDSVGFVNAYNGSSKIFLVNWEGQKQWECDFNMFPKRSNAFKFAQNGKSIVINLVYKVISVKTSNGEKEWEYKLEKDYAAMGHGFYTIGKKYIGFVAKSNKYNSKIVILNTLNGEIRKEISLPDKMNILNIKELNKTIYIIGKTENKLAIYKMGEDNEY
jgi:hypothetical protein